MSIVLCRVNNERSQDGASIYAATKAAVRSFARSWTVDLKHRKIRVNVISPGVIETPISAGLSKQQKTYPSEHHPSGANGKMIMTK